MSYDFSAVEKKFADTAEWLAREYRGLRTGRATPAILDSIMVTAYGSQSPLKQVANIATEDPRTLRVSAWDSSLVKEVERAITNANLGVGIIADSQGVRVSFPELTGERRKELIKVAKAKLEEARAGVRVARDEVWKDIQEQERAGAITEDDKYRLKDELQKKVDAANEKLEQVFKHKEQEMTA
jgi:ribosome recycling factor